MSAKGSVMVHVLITSVIVSLIAAGLMRMSLARATATSRANEGAATKKKAEAAFAQILPYWAQNGLCSSGIPGGWSCSGSVVGSCGCTCTNAVGNQPLIETELVNGSCELTITAPPP